MHSIWKTVLRLGVLLTFLSACSPATATVAPSASPTYRGVLIPYHTRTPVSATASPLPQGTSTLLPSPTPTPLTHLVKQGEDMTGIAIQYGISVDTLLKANPSVNPRAMSVGIPLIIPVGGRATPTVLAPTPTPIPLTMDPLACYPTPEGGLWCFLPIHNNQETAVENLTAWVRVAGVPAQKYLEGTAGSALNLLPPGASLPLTTYFPPPVPSPFQASAGLVSALPVGNPQDGGRYLPAHMDNQHILIDPSGLTARVSGEALLDAPDTTAATIWVVAVAYDAQNHMVGVRRWENQQPLAPGKRLSFDLTIFTLSGAIQRIDTLIEARP